MLTDRHNQLTKRYPVHAFHQVWMRHRRIWKTATSLSLVVSGCLISQPTLAELSPDQMLLAQQIVDGLPPPPSLPFGSQIPVTPSQPQIYQSPDAGSPSLAPVTSSSTADERFLVYVNGDSPLLLNQVRRIESGAFLQEYNGRQVIQAGLFDQPTGAEQRAAELASQGIGAEVVKVARTPVASSGFNASGSQAIAATPSPLPQPQILPTTPVQREIEFGQQPLTTPVTQQPAANSAAPDNSYYVVIPERSENLQAVTAQVIRLGGGLAVAQAVDERRSPRGPHVLVGPFVNRQVASRWNRYFRDFGLDAQVYYRR